MTHRSLRIAHRWCPPPLPRLQKHQPGALKLCSFTQAHQQPSRQFPPFLQRRQASQSTRGSLQQAAHTSSIDSSPDKAVCKSAGGNGHKKKETIDITLPEEYSDINLSYPPFWLRDHCQCEKCVHPETKQRILDTFSLPAKIDARSIRQTSSGVLIEWDHDDHSSFYSYVWLDLHRFGQPNARSIQSTHKWEFYQHGPRQRPPQVSYKEILGAESGIKILTSLIRKFGFCFINDTPVTPEATKELLERISFIRNTHYGGFWDFTSDLSSKDTAYTSLALPLHTDTTYFTDPAGLQLFHCLSHTSSPEDPTIGADTNGDSTNIATASSSSPSSLGGESLLLDGFAAAANLLASSPVAYHILSKIRIPSHASGNADADADGGISISPSRHPFGCPVLIHKARSGSDKRRIDRLAQIRWNNDDRATKTQWKSVEEMEGWYWAAGKWVEVLRDEGEDGEGNGGLGMEFTLEPGRPLIFDNWRMLHGRRGFKGKRRICGGYINYDDFLSRYLMTNFGRDEVLKRI